MFAVPIDYAVFQHEVGAQGTPHFQGFIQFSKKVRLSQLKKVIAGNANIWHWESAKGTASQARAYCMKDDTRSPGTQPYEIGDWEDDATTKGERTDLKSAIQRLKETGSLAAVAESHPVEVVKFNRGLQYLANFRSIPEPDTPPTIRLYYGPAGCGKSRLARQLPPNYRLYVKPVDPNFWFDNYDQEEVVLLDDFNGRDCIKLVLLLQLLDRYVVRLPVKGGFVLFRPREVRITTNIHPSLWYDFSGRQEQYAAIERRVTELHLWRKRGSDLTPDGSEQLPVGGVGSPHWRVFWDVRPPAAYPPVVAPLPRDLDYRENAPDFKPYNFY